MIAFALIGLIVVYVIGLIWIYRKSERYFYADLGVIFSTFVFVYTAVPAITFLTLDLANVPGWPWQELNQLRPDEESLSDHLWRHNLFLAAFLSCFICIRKRISADNFQEWIDRTRVGTAGLKTLIVIFLCLSAAKLSLSEVSGAYVDLYVQTGEQESWRRVLLAVLSRGVVGVQYLMLIFTFSCPIKYWKKLAISALVIAYQLYVSHGSRIEVLFLVLAIFCLYNIYVSKVRFLYLASIALVGVAAFSFIEVFRFYEYDMEASLRHFEMFGLKPMGEFGAVFLPGYHLYQVQEAGLMPYPDIRMFFFDIVSLFQSNSDSEFSPQNWYWRNYYPDDLAPPQTNGPISDSAIWGGGVYDLVLRASMVGAVFAFVSNLFYSGRYYIFCILAYLLYFSTSVMTLKYGVLWQLNPLVKTIIPTVVAYYSAAWFCRKFVHG